MTYCNAHKNPTEREIAPFKSPRLLVVMLNIVVLIYNGLMVMIDVFPQEAANNCEL